jgi:ElaB/YqjD/DUF883 family membrane-anchored ribosome-binding protein
MVRIESLVKGGGADADNDIDDGVDTIDTSMNRFSARLASLKTQLRERSERVLANARDLGDVASNQMRSHPLAAFGVAFVAGIVIARLLRR